MQALTSHGTWELMTRPEGARVVGSRWVFTVKHRADGSVE